MTRHLLVGALIAGVMTMMTTTLSYAAANSDLAHRCSYKYGAGDYQNVSYSGAASCAEAGVVIDFATNNGQRAPRVGVRTVTVPRSRWRCTTVRRIERKGYVSSDYRTTCIVSTSTRQATVRFFRVG